MSQSGPPLEALLRRLAETPQEFLDEPAIGKHGRIVVSALVNDLLNDYGQAADMATLAPYISSDQRADRNRLGLVMIAVWLLRDDCLMGAGLGAGEVHPVLNIATRDLAAVSAAHNFVEDADRREELVRTMLSRLELRPQGESEKQAADRLTAISSVERGRLLAASREAEKRAREVREALARKAAKESADKWSRE